MNTPEFSMKNNHVGCFEFQLNRSAIKGKKTFKIFISAWKTIEIPSVSNIQFILILPTVVYDDYFLSLI